MAVTKKKAAKPAGAPGAKGWLPNLAKFGCVGFEVEVVLPKSFRQIEECLRKVTRKPVGREERATLDFSFKRPQGGLEGAQLRVGKHYPPEYERAGLLEPPEGEEQMRARPLRGNALSIMMSDFPLVERLVDHDLAEIRYAAFRYHMRFPDELSSDDPQTRRRAKAETYGASSLLSILGSLGGLSQRPLEMTVNAAFYFRFGGEAQPWAQEWPGIGPVEVSGINLSAKRTGLEVTLRLAEEEAARGVFVSVEGVKMRGNLDAGVLDRACNAAFVGIAPFVRVTFSDGKK